MKKQAKRLIALLLTFSMALSMLSTTAWATNVVGDLPASQTVTEDAQPQVDQSSEQTAEEDPAESAPPEDTPEEDATTEDVPDTDDQTEETPEEEAPAAETDEETLPEETLPEEEADAETMPLDEEIVEPDDTLVVEEEDAVVLEARKAGDIRSAIANAIFLSDDNVIDMSEFNTPVATMDNLTDQVLNATNTTDLVKVTYAADEVTGDATTMIVETDEELQVVKDELENMRDSEGNAPTEEQTQQILGLYSQYMQHYRDNANYLGRQTPFFVTKEKDTTFGPLESMLTLAGHTSEEVANGEYSFDEVMGTIQIFYYSNVKGIEYYGSQLLAAKDEALKALSESDAQTEAQKMLVLNDWMAHNAQFDMAYIMNESDRQAGKDPANYTFVAEEPTQNEHYNDLYTFFHDSYYNQYYDQMYQYAYYVGADLDGDGVQDTAGNDELSKQYAQAAAEQAGAMGGAQMADGVIGAWNGNLFGVLCMGKGVCMAYTSAFAYLLQWIHPEIYGVNGASTDLSKPENWKSNDELLYVTKTVTETYTEVVTKTDENGQPIQAVDEEGNPIYKQVVDEEGNPVQDTNEDGSLKYEQMEDENGNLVDDLTKPVYKTEPVYETEEVEKTKEVEVKEFSTDAPYMVDFVRITFDADVVMYGIVNEGFNSDHFWNAVKVDGKWYYIDPCYTDIFVECMSRDRVETNGSTNHMYFLISDTTVRQLYEGYYSKLDTLYEGVATDKTYESSWMYFAKSNVYSKDGKFYYYYDSTDLISIMNQFGGMGGFSGEDILNAGYEDLIGESEYKLVYHDAKDDSDSFTELVNFNDGTALDPASGSMVENELLQTLWAQFQEDKQKYPSVSVSSALYGDKLYFNLSNCILSYDLTSGEIVKVKEYNKVSAYRDKTVAFGGLAFEVVDNDSENAEVTVNNAPIAGMTIKEDGKMYIDIATNYAFISGKDPHNMNETGYGYEFQESNYNPDYSSYITSSGSSYGQDEINDNDEFMWSANFVDTVSMSELTGDSHNFETVTVDAYCGQDAYTEERCADCGLIKADTREVQEGTACDHHYVKFDEEYYTKDDNGNWNTGTSYVCTICGYAVEEDDTADEVGEGQDCWDDAVAKAGHTYVAASEEDVIWAEDNTSATVQNLICGVCGSHTCTVTQNKDGENSRVTHPDLDCLMEDETLRIEDANVACDVTTETSGTCEEGLTITYTATGKADGDYAGVVFATKTEQGEPGAHNYQVADEDWQWTENEDGTYTVVAKKMTCSVCGDVKENVTAKVTSETVAEPTCTEDGKVVYTAVASVTAEDGTVLGSVTTTKEVATPALGHQFDDHGVCTICGMQSKLTTPVMSAVSNSATGVVVKWEAVENAKGYKVFRRTNNGGWESLAVLDGGDTLTYTDTKAESGVYYTYTVRAYQGSKELALANCHKEPYWSGYESGLSVTYLSIPTMSTPSNGADGITVTWSKVTGAEGYQLWRKDNGEGAWNLITTVNSGSTTSYTDKNVSSGKKYVYTVRSCKTVNGTLYRSNYISAGKTMYYLDIPTLSTPSNVADGVTVKWGTVAGADGYQIWRKDNGKAPWILVTTVNSGTATSYTDTEAQSGVKYIYTVRACKTENDVLYRSNYLSAGKTIYYLAIPTMSEPTNAASGVTVKWSKVDGADGYQLWRRDNGEGAWKLVTTVNSGSTTSYTDKNVSSGKKYVYTVRSCKTVSGTLYRSNYISEGKTMYYLSVPTLSTPSNVANGVTVKWGKVTGAEGYQVWRKDNGEGSWKLVTTVNSGSTTSYTDTQVQSGVKYVYTVRACKTVGDLLYRSNYVSAGKTMYYLAIPTMSEPSNATSGITVKWSQVDGADGYQVWRRNNGEGSWILVTTVNSGSTTSYTDKNVTSGTKYVYTVRSCKTVSGTLYRSNYISEGKTMYYLSVPTLGTPANAAKGVTVKWGKVTGATGYQIWRKDNGEGSWILVGTVKSGSTTSYTDTGVTKGTKYVYTVRACKVVGDVMYRSSYLSAGKTITYQ